MTPTRDAEPQLDDLSERARAWTLMRDVRCLWPALDVQALQPSADAIGRAVTKLLDGRSTTLGSANGQDAYAIGIAAHISGTGPLLGHWVEKSMLDVSDGLARILGRHLAQGRLRVDRITREVAPALSSLVATGLTPLVIKGFHTAYAYFPEPGLRPLADVDVVLAPAEIPQAEGCLRDAGFAPSDLIARPYKRDWYPPSDDGRLWSFELFDARDRWKLELHDGINFGQLTAFGLRLDPGRNSSQSWRVAGVSVCVPAQPYLTGILATHLSCELHMKALLRALELVLVIRRDRALGLLDWTALAVLLEGCRATRFVYPGLSIVEKLAPGTVDQALLTRARTASTPLARVVADRLSPTRPILEDRPLFAERLMWIASPTDAMHSIANWLNPTAGRPWGEILSVYHSRLVRLLAGRVGWMGGPEHR